MKLNVLIINTEHFFSVMIQHILILSLLYCLAVNVFHFLRTYLQHSCYTIPIGILTEVNNNHAYDLHVILYILINNI